MSGPVLITGARGFVGRHLTRQLGDAAVPAEVDVTSFDQVVGGVRAAQPGAVVHLAASSSVASSWESAAGVWHVNAVGTVNVLEAVRAARPAARTLVVSTGEVYGRSATIPTPEECPVAPLSPYAASKAAAEIACERARRADGLDVVVARSFPHAGPGQDERFAIGSWTRQIARLESVGGGRLLVGDLSVRRDVTDVRDVCRAYELLLDPAVPARIYNVASGTAVPMAQILDLLVAMAQCTITVEPDPVRLRPAEVPVLAGDAARLRGATGWRPEIPLETTLAEALADARRLVIEERIVTA